MQDHLWFRNIDDRHTVLLEVSVVLIVGLNIGIM